MKKNKLKIENFSMNQIGKDQMITISGGDDGNDPGGTIGGGPHVTTGGGGGTLPDGSLTPPLVTFTPGTSTVPPKPTNT